MGTFLSPRANLKQLLNVAMSLAILFGVAQLLQYGPPRFWHDFTGRTEAEVVARLGRADRDDRRAGSGDGRHHTLAWHQGMGVFLILEFQDGAVKSQRRLSRG